MVLAPLPANRPLQILSNVAVHLLESVAKISRVALGLRLCPRFRFRCGEEEVKRLGCWPAKQDLEGGGSGGARIHGPEGEQGLWQGIFPCVRMFTNHSSEHLAQIPMHSLHLTITLGVVSSGVGETEVQDTGEFLEESLSELFATVRVDGVWHSEVGEHIGDQGLGGRVGRRMLEGKRFDPFGEAVPTSEQVLGTLTTLGEGPKEVQVDTLEGIPCGGGHQGVPLVRSLPLLGLAREAVGDHLIDLRLHAGEEAELAEPAEGLVGS